MNKEIIKIGLVVYLEETNVNKNTRKLINNSTIDDMYNILKPSNG